jgi:hypothetical protein
MNDFQEEADFDTWTASNKKAISDMLKNNNDIESIMFEAYIAGYQNGCNAISGFAQTLFKDIC